MSPEANRRLAEGHIQKKLKSILTSPEGDYLASLLLTDYVCNLMMTLSLGNLSGRRVRHFEISKYQINLEKLCRVKHKIVHCAQIKHKIVHFTCRSKPHCACVDLIFLIHLRNV